jgi:hypothetical protein
MTSNAAVQPQIRAQREFVGWNCLLDANFLITCRMLRLAVPLSHYL